MPAPVDRQRHSSAVALAQELRGFGGKLSRRLTGTTNPAVTRMSDEVRRFAKYIRARNVLYVTIETGGLLPYPFAATRKSNYAPPGKGSVRSASWTVRVDVDRLRDDRKTMGVSVVDGLFALNAHYLVDRPTTTV